MADETATLPRPMLTGVGGFYFTGEDSLRLTSLNSVAGVVLTLSGRFLPVDRARPEPLEHAHTPNSDRTAASSDAVLGEGWLLNLTLVASSGAPPIGATFARVDVVRGRGAAARVVATLLQGGVTAAQRIAWPGSPIHTSVDGAGQIRSITGTDPAANVEISETVPTGARWRLLALTVLFVTDATAADREVSLTFDDGALVYARYASSVVHAASLQRNYTASPAGVRGASAGGTEILIAIAPLILAAGHRIRTNTIGLQGGDNYGAPQLLVEEWLDGA